MRFRTQIAWALVIQGTGAAALLVAALLISVFLGAVPQGTFSRAKAELDFTSALVMLGLPQSLFFYVHRSRLSVARAMSLAAHLAVIGAAGGVVYALLSLHWQNYAAIVYSLAVAASVWHGSLRALVLAVVSTRAFNLVTALPQGLLFVYSLLAIGLGRLTYFDATVAFALVYFAAGAISALTLRTAANRHADSAQEAVPLGSILQYGLASGLAAIGSTLSLLLAMRIVLWRLGTTELGIFSLAGTLAQGALVPLSYVIPLLFRRWMQRPPISVPLVSGVLAAGGICGVSGAIYALGTCLACGKELGTYAPITGILWILLLGAGADACNRIVAVAANAGGRPWLSTLAEGSRLAIVALGVTLMAPQRMSDVAWVVCYAAVGAALLIVTLYSICEKPRVYAL